MTLAEHIAYKRAFWLRVLEARFALGSRPRGHANRAAMHAYQIVERLGAVETWVQNKLDRRRAFGYKPDTRWKKKA